LPRRTKPAALLAALWLAVATLAREASADMFRYTDRSGRAHVVSTGRPPATPGSTAPSSPDPTPPDAPAAGRPPAPEPPAPAARYYELAREAAEANAVPVELLLAVAEVESGFDPRAVSPKGALGLMQLMPATASLLGVTDPFDPRQSVGGGARLLRSLLDEFGGQLVLALAAYNAGAGVVRRYGVIPPIKETQEYVVAVLKAYQRQLGELRPARGAVVPSALSLERAFVDPAATPAPRPPTRRKVASRAAPPGRRPTAAHPGTGAARPSARAEAPPAGARPAAPRRL
jgi:soluble lytic murein transglycosylase-like protein